MLDLVKVGKIVTALKEGKALFMEHGFYGTYVVRMNQQQNVISAKAVCDKAKYHEKCCYKVTQDGEAFTTSCSIEQGVERFILWGHGSWKIEIEAPRVETVLVGGVYETI